MYITEDHTTKPSAEHIKEHHTKNVWKLYVDGASRNNPGPSGAGVVLMKNGKVALKKGFFVGIKTNNEAEYLALLLGIFFLKEYVQPHDAVIIISDSQLLIRQFKGEYRVKKPELQLLYNLAKKLLHLMQYECYHVLRHENEMADEMANYGIDEKVRVPVDFVALAQQHGVAI